MGFEGEDRQHTCHSLVFTFGASRGVLERSDKRGGRDRRHSDGDGDDGSDVKSGKDRFGHHAAHVARDRRDGDVGSLESYHKPHQHEEEGVTHLD